MNDTKELLQRARSQFPPPEDVMDSLIRRRDRKRRNQRIAAGVVGIAVFVAAIWIVMTGGSFNHTQQPAIQPTPTPEPSLTAPEPGFLIDLNTGEKTQLPKSIADGFLYAASPDGTMVAFTSGDDAGTPQVFIASLDGTDVQQVTHDQRGAWAPDWSPDGAAIAYTSGDGDVNNISNVFVLDLATGETSQVTNEKPPTETCYGPTVDTPCAPLGATSPQFSPDGASILYDVHRVGDDGVRIVPVTGGKSVLLVDRAAERLWGPTSLGTLSPDGSTLAVGCGGWICIAHADGTNLRGLVSRSALFGPKWSPDGTRVAYNNQAAGPTLTVQWPVLTPTGTKVFVVDVATGETTFVAEGIADDWLDDHTLIIRPGYPP